MTSSIDGLVSGLSTSSLIGSLMQVEAAPRDRLKTKVSNAETVVGAYLAVNAKLLALKSNAGDLGNLATWRSVKPAVSSTAVTATASGGLNSVTGSVTLDVKKLAQAQISTARFAVVPQGQPEPNVTSADTFTVQFGAEAPVTIDVTADKTAQGVANALNKAGIGLKATVVTASNGDKVLQLTGTKTGAANGFQFGGLDFSPIPVVPAADATIEVGGGDGQPGGYTVTSASNTFTGLMSGLTVTASKVEDDVTINVISDVSGIAAKVQALVDAANATLTEVSKQTAYDPATKKGSPLTGDFSAREIGSALLGKVSQGLGKLADADPEAFGTLRKLGIQLSPDGRQLAFNANTFTGAYNEDPDLIKKATTAFAETIEKVATTQSTGVTAAINGRKTLIDSMNDQIDNWAVRLASRQEALQKQYATLETSLSKLKSQSTWLSGQLAGL